MGQEANKKGGKREWKPGFPSWVELGEMRKNLQHCNTFAIEKAHKEVRNTAKGVALESCFLQLEGRRSSKGDGGEYFIFAEKFDRTRW